MKKVIAVVGPTASGKSKLAIDLAKRFCGAIISCDSVAVYKGLDIGSAKPSPLEQKEAKHYLIDILDVKDKFDVAKCQQLARDIIAVEEVPILCGGTGLYINAILHNYEFLSPKRDEAFANKYKDYDNESLYNLLVNLDKKIADSLHPNNRKRILRALEVAMSGQKISDFKHKNEALYDYYLIYIDIERDILYKRINERVDAMFKAGLVNEVKNLYEQGILVDAIGYKEFEPYFKGLISLEEVKEQIKLNTRHLAKRQKTWFKNQMQAHFYAGEDYEKLLANVSKDVALFLEGRCESI